MKKILLTTAVALLSSFNAYAEEGDFYAKVQGGMSMLAGNKASTIFEDKDPAIKMKSKKTVFAGLGAGYYFMNNFRVEAVVESTFSSKLHGKYVNSENKDINQKFNIKPKLNNLMINALLEFADLDAFKLFAGVGVGVAQVGYKISGSYTNPKATSVPAGATKEQVAKTAPASAKITGKAKNTIGVAFAGHIGASYELNDNINLDLTYSYKALPKSKSGTASADLTFATGSDDAATKDNKSLETKPKSIKNQSHNISLGLRFTL